MVTPRKPDATHGRALDPRVTAAAHAVRGGMTVARAAGIHGCSRRGLAQRCQRDGIPLPQAGRPVRVRRAERGDCGRWKREGAHVARVAPLSQPRALSPIAPGAPGVLVGPPVYADWVRWIRGEVAWMGMRVRQ